MQKITPHLWYTDKAAEAARFYASIFPDSRVERVTPIASDSPSGPAGSVDMVEFTLFGQPFKAISAGPLDPFNHAISFMVNCDTQEEIAMLKMVKLDIAALRTAFAGERVKTGSKR